MITGSALRKLSAMTGLEAKKPTDGCYGLYITPEFALFSVIKDEKAACQELRDANLRRVCQLVFLAQEWKCAGCGQMRGLSGHHRKFRSRWKRTDGPLDVERNIVGLCSECHSKVHDKGE